MSDFSQYTEALHEECGVFGMYDKTGETDMVNAVYSALYALQHRGQESCGIALNVDGVLSGHRGLPSAKLFTNLDQLVEGDTFTIRVLDEVLTYEVDQILIVEPEDVSALEIIPGRDLCTLVTCTPYGINTHRLLVRGTRIENEPQAQTVRVTSDAVQIEPLLVAPVLAAPVLLTLLLVLLLPGKQKRKKEED